MLIAGFLGALSGFGAVMVVAGVLGRRLLHPKRQRSGGGVPPIRRALRCALALAAAGGAFAITSLPVLALVAAVGGYSAPTAWATRHRTRHETDRVEGIATWTEQLRDVLGGASGLHSALGITAALAPMAIRSEAERLAARLEYQRTSVALRRFAEEVDHPIADFVVAALVVAADNEARNLAGLLGRLADTARDEARLRTKVWVSRARLRTSVRVTAVVIPTMVAAVALVDRHYLDPYNSAGGQVALAAVLLVFVTALGLMSRIGRVRLPARFLTSDPTPVVAG